MELYTVNIKMTLVLATPDGEEPTDKDIAKALKREIDLNGFEAGMKKVVELTRKSRVPAGWEDSLPWSTRKKVNKRDRYVDQILLEDKGDQE
jgi:hypothetical protein